MKYAFFIYLFFSCAIAYGQMTYGDFIKVYNMDFDQFEIYAIGKGYEFKNVKDNDNTYGHTYVKGVSKQTKYLSLYNRWFSDGKHVTYQTSNSAEMISIKNFIKTKGYKLFNSETFEGDKFDYYRNQKYQFTFVSIPRENGNDYEIGFGTFTSD